MIGTIIQRRLAAATPPHRPVASSLADGPDPALADVPVLVIEDECMIAWMLESLLEEMGFEAIALASDAAEAATAAATRAPGLVISDINLGPGIDGIAAVERLCATCSPAVIFVSAYAGDGARSRIARTVGRARILPKPLSSETLFSVVREALGLDRPH